LDAWKNYVIGTLTRGALEIKHFFDNLDVPYGYEVKFLEGII
jgi:hypothetical protein